MKPLPLLLSFLPLIAFSLLTRVLPSGDVGVAGLVAALCAVAAMATSRPVWPPKILTATSLVLFIALAAVGFAGRAGTDRWLATWAGAGVGIVIGLVILLLLPVMPFTEQFARQSTPKAYWGSPTFRGSTGCSAPGGAERSWRPAPAGSPPRPCSAAAATGCSTCCWARPSRS
jgi:hypothetical protein